MNRWAQKIIALLHDPPHKAWVLGSRLSHQALARELQELVLGEGAGGGPEEERARRADWIASAADRLNLPPGSEAYWTRENAVLVHPLSGRRLDLGRMNQDPRELQRDIREALMGLLTLGDGDGQEEADAQGQGELKDRYLRLWRLLGETLEGIPKLGPLAFLAPADTRQPDHSLLQHLTMAAALADALPRPAFLVFSLGPVQGFIAEARRTQDLWAGSWLLSYLAWKAMEALAETFGPDVIVYPSLRGQPLCDLWLTRRKGIPLSQPDPEALGFASLPNKLVALLPAEEAEGAADRAKQAVRAEWERLAEAVYERLHRFASVDERTREIWEAQIERHWEIYWATLPWPGAERPSGRDQAEAVQSLYKALLGPRKEFHRIYETLKKSGQYEPNWGTVYSLLYDLVDRAFQAHKVLRAFEPSEEKGEKCTVCGRRAALRAQDRSAKAFWQEAAERLAARGRRDIRPEGRERLCAVCTLKRFVQREVLQEELKLDVGFPSTSEVAAAPFKARALEKLREGDSKVAEPLRRYLDWLEDRGIPATVTARALPHLESLRAGLPGEKQKLAQRLIRYDGEWFFTESLTPQRLREAVPGITEQEAEREVGEGREHLRALQKALGRPAKYYALLRMDGDHMGRWLSGTHDKLPSFGEVLHPKVREELEKQEEWREVLGEKRLVTPALHAAISGALADFSLQLTRWIVEERHRGRLIYAGGDDVLALLPLEDALPAARELRAAFSGEVEIRKGDLIVKFQDDRLSGYLPGKEGEAPRLLLTLGPKATASVGLAVAHHLHPLDLVLQAARRAERVAKDDYGRNALVVEVLKRSGETLTAGMPWVYRAPPNGLDAVALLLRVCKKLQEGHLSMRFPQHLAWEAPTLAGLPPEAQGAELRRLLGRQAGEAQGATEKQQTQELGEHLIALAQALEERYPQRSGIEQLADWLLVCSFLVRGGEA